MIDAERIAEMNRLSEVATPGPWVHSKLDDTIEKFNEYTTDWQFLAKEVSESDGEFIAESRQFVPDIIAAYESKCEQVGVLVDGLNKAVDEIVKLREALEFIEDVNEYASGHIARDALK